MSCTPVSQYQQDVTTMRHKALRRGVNYQTDRLRARKEHADNCKKLANAFLKAWEAQTK